MSETVHCDTHGETEQTFVCSHLAEPSHGLGFHRDVPSDDDAFPDAWCDACELIRAAHDGWTDAAQKLVSIKLICSGCYERTRIRNSKPTVTLDELATLRWKCGSCDEWHTGPSLDFGYDAPHHWDSSSDCGTRWSILPSGALHASPETFLDSDYCAIDNESFFVRGIIELPILGAAESFRWGVWGSLSRAKFEMLIRADEAELQPEKLQMFSWLSTRLPDYPDTLNLRMTALIQEIGTRPHFKLDAGDHPLVQEYYHGITPERVKELMLRMLPAQPE